MRVRVVLGAIAGVIATAPAWADSLSFPSSYGLYGTPGMIDMPTALSAPDAEFALTSSYFSGQLRNTMTFQILPRISGSFRYSIIDNYTGPGTPTRYDRSFDLRFRFIDESTYRPAVAVGFQDFIGTGLYSGEYLVATKHITPRLRFSGGIGWGRFGSYGSFSNPLGIIDDGFNTRPTGTTGQGGVLESAKWFRGPAAVFGGVEWRATDKLTLTAEYSSDAYTQEAGVAGLFTHSMPFNFGATYQLAPGMQLGAYYLYGSTFGASLNFTLNPKDKTFPSGLAPAPVPVAPRASNPEVEASWNLGPKTAESARVAMGVYFERDGLVLDALDMSETRAVVRFRNTRYQSVAMAVGRVARILTNVAPASVEVFEIVPMENGMALSSVVVMRSDVEELEHAPDGAWELYSRAQIGEAPALGMVSFASNPNPQPLSWYLAPYIATNTFDPDNPFRFDLGLELKARYELTPGLFLSGGIRKKLVGNLDQSTRVSNSVLPRVRTDYYLYDQNGDPAINDLTLASYFRPGPNLYGRVTAGYLERMFGGVSAELLWKPVNSRFALGAEINYAKQRDFDVLFGFQNYDIVSGHVSGYLELPQGFQAQVDAGRYLAGDWGGTLTVERTFRNGWRLGAFATLTDVSFRDFGEGSFDKGLLFTIPLETITGRSSTTDIQRTLRPITRDGGARLEVDGRLYGIVRGYHESELTDQWGTFWR